MKKTNTPKKVNVLYLTISIVLIAVFVVVSILFVPSKEEREIKVTDLPEEYTSNINQLIINEILTNNDGSYVNENGTLSDFVELYNGTENDIDLTGYGLSDDESEVKWVFPQTVIKAKGYIVVNLTGNVQEGLNAPFKLDKNGGETVILVKPNGKVADAIKTVPTNKNQVMARVSDGSWVIYNFSTPKFENSVKGRSAYLESIDKTSEDAKIIINEFLAKNKGNFANEDDRYEGFVELKNISKEVVDLSNYFISNDKNNLYKFKLKGITLNPNEIVVLYAGDKVNTNKCNYLSMNFAGNNGTVILSTNTAIVSKIEYSNLDNGLAYIFVDNNYYIDNVISPGYENSTEGIKQFQKKVVEKKSGLIISEVMSKNDTLLPQNGNQYYDWIELFNNSDTDIKLSDYYLTDSDSNLTLYHLPEITLKSNSYIVVMCSGNSNLTNKSYYHTNFKIGDNNSIYLTNGKEIKDALFVSNVPYGYSYGVNLNDKAYYYFDKPTPNSLNGKGVAAIAYTPVVKTLGGVYNDIKQLSVEIVGEGTIYYSLDGTIPTTNSKKYSGPISLEKTTVLRCLSVVNGKKNSQENIQSYVINENHTMDVISVVMDPSDFKKINNNPDYEYEVKGYVQFFEDGNSFSEPCMISLFGGSARYVAKKSYTLRFEDKVGSDGLIYPLFENRDSSLYKEIVIRSGSTEYNRTGFRDLLATGLADEYTDLDTLAYRCCIYYVNGEYRGIYSIREKCNTKFIANHYNVDKDSVSILRIDGELKGNISGQWYKDIRNFVNTHDIAIDANYEKLCEMIDINNTVDYWIGMTFTSNNDVLNIRMFKSDELDGGKMKWIFYDYDYAFQNINMNYYKRYMAYPGGMGLEVPPREHDIIKSLLKNKQFQKLWCERLYYNLTNTWKTETVLNRIDELTALYKPEIARERKRWNLTVDSWYNEIDKLKDYCSKRNGYILKQTKEFFNLSNAQMKEYFKELW